VLKPTERSVVFVLFCAITAICIAIETYLLYTMIAQGFTAGKAVASVLNGTIIFGVGQIFIKLLTKTFLESQPPAAAPAVPTREELFDELHRFASDRCRTLCDNQETRLNDFASRQRLITQILAFAEGVLRERLPGSHFEICIFVDREQPLLFAYFDSNHSSTARSMRDREQNPNLYIEKNYEVVKVLTNPSSHPLVVRNTERVGTHYAFASKQQRKQLKSTMLWCFDVDNPSAIVVTSNAKDAFQETDAEVESFIKFVGTLARFDLLERRFLHRIRDMRPDLFSNVTAEQP
jgi:hypothetical protein